MSQLGLRPEEPAAIRIREAATRGTLSHALLFTGNGDLAAAAGYAAAALECVGTAERPCGVCPACRKVLAGIHPDVITVRDPDHKNIAVDVVREIRADAYIRPNEGNRKVYVFPDCALLTEQDQNVLLKVVEEGPPYAAFLFCAENAAVVLQTLRSRCVELKLHPGEEQGGEEVRAAEDLPTTYNLYMGGDFGETILETNRPELPDVLIFGDSFTNPLETLFYTGFDETRSLDLRYNDVSLLDYVAEHRPDVVLCVRDDTSYLSAEGNGRIR